MSTSGGPESLAGARLSAREGGRIPLHPEKTSVFAARTSVLPCLAGWPGVGAQGTLLAVFREHTRTCQTEGMAAIPA